jgi:hypothetical protein
MFAVSRRRGFTLRDLLAVILVIGIGLMLLMLALPRMNSGAPSGRNACINNMRQIGLALHNYHHVYKKFPTVAADCDNLFEQRIGHGSGSPIDCTMAQYSWIVQILPYLEEANLYNELAADSDKFRIAAFDPSLRVGKNGDSRQLHFSQVSIPTLLCPAFTGDSWSDNRPPADVYTSVGVKTDPITGKPVGVALTNYVAIAATHKERLMPHADNPPVPNGVIVPGKGTVAADITDDKAHTIVLAETKEQSNSSWYDSSGTWVVALLPRQSLPADLNPAEFPLAYAQDLKSALNVGPTARKLNGYGDGLPDNVMRRWGPSSDHSGDIVIHCFADNSVRAINADIDPLVYAALVTPNGGEEIDLKKATGSE